MNTKANRPPVMNPARGDKRRGRGRGSGLCTPARPAACLRRGAGGITAAGPAQFATPGSRANSPRCQQGRGCCVAPPSSQGLPGSSPAPSSLFAAA